MTKEHNLRAFWRSGEVPGSMVLGTRQGAGNNGCIWPGSNGQIFAMRKGHDPRSAYPSFDHHDEAQAYVENGVLEEREKRKEAAKTKARIREDRRMKAPMPGDRKFDLLDPDGFLVTQISRKTTTEATRAAASVLGFDRLPVGYVVRFAA